MNRFGTKKRKSSWLTGLLLPVGFFAAVALTIFYGMGSLGRTTGSEQLRAAEQTIRRAAVHCYAIEGSYPASLDYLIENYGILVDDNRFLVHYQTMGTNLMPNIVVIPLDGSVQAIEEETP